MILNEIVTLSLPTLSVRRLGLNLVHPWKLARTERTSIAHVVIVELKTPDGLVGRGEAAPITRYGETTQTVETFLAQPPLQSLSGFDAALALVRTLTPGNWAAKCALDIALHDLAAQQTQMSVSEHFGLSFHEGKHLTSFTIGIDEPAVIKSKVIAAEAFPILKMKVGVSSDRENLSVLREAAPKKWLRLDANEGWKTKEEALQSIEALAHDSRIQFVEQPMPASTSISDWAWLKNRSPLPIFGDESYHSAADAEVAAECFHGVNVKLVKTGGISGAFDALRAARKVGLKTMLGCMIETSVLITAAAHLAELCDYLDLDGNLLVNNDPFRGVTAQKGVLSFADAPTRTGLCVAPR